MSLHPTDPNMHRGAHRFRASQLIGCNIRNSREDSLGDVQDIVLARDNKSIAYVVVAFGGFLGMGEKYFAMPWRMLDVSRSAEDTDLRILLAINQEALKAAPGFDHDKWPDMANPKWSSEIDRFYSVHDGNSHAGNPHEVNARFISHDATSHADRSDGATSGGFRASAAPTPSRSHTSGHSLGRDPDSDTFQARRVSQIIGTEVVDANRESLATIDDLILDGETAKLEGAALSYGGILGLGKQTALVPMESLTLDLQTGKYSLPCSTDDLEAMAIQNGIWPQLDNDEWLARGRDQCDRISHARGQSGSSESWDS